MRLIDADILLKKLHSHHDFYTNAWGGFRNLPPNDKSRVDEITTCIATVRNIPVIEPESLVKRGKWVKMTSNGQYWFACSECDWDDDKEAGDWFNFCPNCGARMEKGEEK